MQSKINLKNIGNAFIALSFFGFVFTYFPILREYIIPQRISIPPGTPTIYIEKINAIAPIIFDVNPWEKAEYLEALSHGVAHAKNTSLPGEKGTVYLFAHSSDAPWRLTQYNTVFLRLNELEYGDNISINIDNNEYSYSVIDKKSVWPNEVEYLENTEKDQLILQTCTPVGTDLKRLLVFAEPVF